MLIRQGAYRWIRSNDTDLSEKSTLASSSASECERGSSRYFCFAELQQGSIGLNLGWNFGKKRTSNPHFLQ